MADSQMLKRVQRKSELGPSSWLKNEVDGVEDFWPIFFSVGENEAMY